MEFSNRRFFYFHPELKVVRDSANVCWPTSKLVLCFCLFNSHADHNKHRLHGACASYLVCAPHPSRTRSKHLWSSGSANSHLSRSSPGVFLLFPDMQSKKKEIHWMDCVDGREERRALLTEQTIPGWIAISTFSFLVFTNWNSFLFRWWNRWITALTSFSTFCHPRSTGINWWLC